MLAARWVAIPALASLLVILIILGLFAALSSLGTGRRSGLTQTR